MNGLRLTIFLICLISQVAWADLQQTVESIVNSANLGGGNSSVCVIDTADSRILVDIRSRQQMIPASNQKLLTSGSAMHILGPSFEFLTQLLWDGETLVIVGDGDPTIGDPDLLGVKEWSTENQTLESELSPWASAVIGLGIKHVKKIVVDDRIFDRNFVHPSWPANQINNWYCAQVAGLNYHQNVVHFFPAPDPESKKAVLGTISPKMPWIKFGNKTTCNRGKNDKSSFWVARLPNSNKMTARGNVKGKHTQPVKVAFHNPPLVFGEVFARVLRAKGVSVDKVEQVSLEAPPSRGKLIFTHRTPLSTVLKRSNTDSYNLYAETLLKRIAYASTGKPGTFDDGAAAVQRSVAQRLTIHPNSVSPADGSGLSRDNKASTEILAKWLASFDVQDLAGMELLDSLATPGSGTLKNRFAKVDLSGAKVHAKSGYIRGVCSLSGYITFENRSPLVFSIMVNNIKGTVKEAKKMQERIVFASWQDTNTN
ncbi:D-alanyl-D-alanine carboxypeptidase/D-alanyl-D-alanine-endopeptidase [PVC group bacterium]|nr:D-alanyl-D-alanine carboxypeptidase/D-alanyl-D-alanine-endopeptidase [PVC group bacterium]